METTGTIMKNIIFILYAICLFPTLLHSDEKKIEIPVKDSIIQYYFKVEYVFVYTGSKIISLDEVMEIGDVFRLRNKKMAIKHQDFVLLKAIYTNTNQYLETDADFKKIKVKSNEEVYLILFLACINQELPPVKGARIENANTSIIHAGFSIEPVRLKKFIDYYSKDIKRLMAKNSHESDKSKIFLKYQKEDL